MGHTTLMRSNAVKTSPSDISKCRIVRSSCRYGFRPSSSGEPICHKHDEKLKPRGNTIILTLNTMWHHVKQKRHKFWIWKAMDRDLRRLPILVHGHCDRAASHQMV